jgi:hypothetical protein
VAWPASVDMRDRASAPTVEAGVVTGAHTDPCGVEVVECSRKRRQAGGGACLGRGATFALQGIVAGAIGMCIVGVGV